jgi:hypothetical protein
MYIPIEASEIISFFLRDIFFVLATKMFYFTETLCTDLECPKVHAKF